MVHPVLTIKNLWIYTCSMLVGQCKFTSDIFKHHMEISSYLQFFFIAYSFRVCNVKLLSGGIHCLQCVGIVEVHV